MKEKFEPRNNRNRFGRNSSNDKESKEDKGKGIQCRECEGYGHIQRECPNFLRKQRKSLVVSWSDSEGEQSDTEQEQVRCVALTYIIEQCEATEASTGGPGSESGSSDSESELTEETITEKYRDLFNKWEKLQMNYVKLKSEKLELSETIERLTKELTTSVDELINTKIELKRFNKYISIMNTGTNKLDCILNAQRTGKDREGIGYIRKQTSSKSRSIPAKSDSVAPVIKKNIIRTAPQRTCYYCKKSGHLLRQCHEFLSKYRRRTQFITRPVNPYMTGATHHAPPQCSRNCSYRQRQYARLEKYSPIRRYGTGFSQ